MILILPAERRFDLGRVVATANAVHTLSATAISSALYRHANCDWGDLCDEDRSLNVQAFAHGGRLFSVYHDDQRRKFYVITEADRSATTVLMPEDY